MSKASNNRRYGYMLIPAITTGLTVTGPLWAQSEQADDASEQTGEVFVLPPVQVEESAPGVPATTVGSKIPLAPREIPQSVSAVGRERIEQQNLETLEDAMREVTGVTIERIDANRLNFYSRGFEITTLQIDGVTTLMDDRVFLSPDLEMYERVEVLRGPAGLLSGAGGAGGAVNLVRKRPQGEPAVSGELSAGSWRNFRGSIDATGALNDDGSLRGRVVGAYQDREAFYDLGTEENALFYGVLEYDVTATTLLTLGGSYQTKDTRAPWTLPGYTDFTLLDIPRDTYLGADWNHDRFNRADAFVELEQRLGSDWMAKVALNHSYSTYSSDQAFAWGAVERGVNTTELYALKFDYAQRQTGVDVHATGPFTLFGREHELLLGASYQNVDFRDPDFSAEPFQLSDSLDIFNPVTDVPRPDFIRDGGTNTTVRQTGVYGNAHFSLSDPLTLVLGGRVSWWDNDIDETGEPTLSDDFDAEFTPLIGAVYDLDDTYSLYASYAQTFQPQTVRDRAGDLLEPRTGEQYEAGVKGEFLDGAVNASLAVFQITERNRAQEDLTAGPDDDFYVAQGEVTNRGFEAELSGTLQPGWDLYAGYTYTHTDDTTDTENGSAFSAIAPKHMFRLWTNYRLPGELNRWSIGGGVKAVSEFYNEFDEGRRLTQSGYATFDARVGYELSRRVSVDLSVTNLFDESYYQRINDPNSGNLYGEPRAFMLTVRGQL